MAISRIKPSNWAVNEKLTSTQLNQIDTSLTYALDKRDGYTDTLSSTIIVDNGGSFTFNSGTSISMASGSNALFAGSVAITSSGSFTSSVGSTVTLAGINNITGNTTFSTGTVTVNSVTTLVGAVTAGNFTLSSLNRVKLASRSATRVYDGMWVPETSGQWVLSASGGYWQTNVNTLSEIILPIDLPHNCVLNDVTVYLQGASGHVGLPSLPFIDIYRTNIVTGSPSSRNTVDPSSDYTDYQLAHSISDVGINWTIDRNTFKYTLVLSSEYGANALTGMKLYGAAFTYTVTEMDDFR